jgi:hypothetical protein
VTEISFFLQQELTVLDGNYLGDMNSDAFMTMRIKTLYILGANCFPTYAKARDDLINMWTQAVMIAAAGATDPAWCPCTSSCRPFSMQAHHLGTAGRKCHRKGWSRSVHNIEMQPPRHKCMKFVSEYASLVTSVKKRNDSWCSNDA